MAKTRWLVSTRKPGLKFKILSRRIDDSDPAAPKAYLTLLGAHGVQFERLVNDEIMARYGYELRVEETPD